MFLLWTVSVLLLAAALLALVVLLAPLRLAARCAYRHECLDYALDVWWLHRAIVHGSHRSGQGEFSVRVLGWRFPRRGQPTEDGAAPPVDEEPEERSERGEPDSAAEEKVRAPRPYEPPAPPSTPPPTAETRDETAEAESGPAATDAAPAGPEPARPTMRERYERLRRKYDEILNSRALFVLRQERLRRALLRCLGGSAKQCLRVVAFDRLRISVRASADDPSVLGLVSGTVTGISSALTVRPSHQPVSFEPVFDRDVFEVEGECVIHTTVDRLTAPVFHALVTFPWFTALIVGFRVWRMGRKKTGSVEGA